MKLFQRLLVAPAALGLLAPISANATEVNLNEIANYSDIESIEFANSFGNDDSSLEPMLAGGEGLIDDSSFDGGFSETTTASFGVDFMLGAVDGGTSAADDAVNATYSFGMSLNTSFTGEDSLDIAIDAGNSGAAGVVEFGGNSSDDGLLVDGISYTFPVGEFTVFVGDSTDGSKLYTTACAYGGPSDTLDDCGNVYSALGGGSGTAAGASYDFPDSGFSVAVGMTTSGSTAAGVLTKESADAYGINASYTGDSFGASLSFADIEAPVAGTTEGTFIGFNGYYIPESSSLPSFSVGFETGEEEVTANGAADTDSSSGFVGLSWDEFGPGSAGIAIGTKQHTLDVAGVEEETMYEAYYSYDINDGMSITPLIFIKEHAADGVDDETGLMVKTSFAF